MIIHSSVKSIGDRFIYGCESIKKVVIPSDISKIGILDFHGFKSLKEFIIPSTIQKIYPYTFFDCISLEKIEIPSSVTSIDRYAFANCSSLKEITIPPSITEIEDYTFFNCTSLVNVNNPPSLISIGYCAFAGCKSLVNLTIPCTVKSIAHDAFRGSEMFEKITINKTTKKLPKIEIKSSLPLIKILLLGSSASGKSSILVRYAKGTFTESILVTIGVDFIKKNFNFDGYEVKCQFWDTAGIEKFHQITKCYYKGTDSFVVVFDSSNYSSFTRAAQYLDELYSELIPTSTILLGNKCDLEPACSKEEIIELENKFKTEYFEVSAKKDINIKKVFEYLAKESYQIICDEIKNVENLINNNYDDDDDEIITDDEKDDKNKDEKKKKCIIS